MCGRGKGPSLAAKLAILAGVIIVLALLLPPAFWWMVLAIALIGCGIRFLRCR